MYKLIDRTIGKAMRFIERMKVFPISPNFIDELNNKSILDSVEYAYEFFGQASYRHAREDLWDYCINLSGILPNETGSFKSKAIILEFGVWEGKSINYFAKKCPHAAIFGFDSFTGLHEEWAGVVIKKGDATRDGIYRSSAFDVKGRLPKVPTNVKLIKGYFQETLPKFSLKAKVSIMHIDCDTYDSTIYVLNKFAKNLVKGSIIIFDEYYGFTNWRSHEHKALMDFSHKNKKDFKYIAYTSVHVAVQII